MPSQLPQTLREYLQQEDQNLAERANNLWRISIPIHERQNRPDSNENGLVHVLAVEDNVWRLLQTTMLPNKANNLENFVPFELFLLCCAACCHDFDKALKSALPEGFEHGKGSGDFVGKNIHCNFNHHVLNPQLFAFFVALVGPDGKDNERSSALGSKRSGLHKNGS